MSKLAYVPEAAKNLGLSHGFFDDFLFFTTVHNGWTTVASDSGTIAVADGAGGVVQLNPSDGTVANNDETYLKRTAETFLMAAGKPIEAAAYLKFTEGNTDDANIWWGLKDAVAADTILDNGGMAASFSGFGFYKKDGETQWRIIASLSTTQTDVLLSSANTLTGLGYTAGGSYQKLEVAFVPKNSTQADIMYYIDGVCVYKITDFVFTSATEMQAGFGIKNGADTTVEALLVDWVYAYQKR